MKILASALLMFLSTTAHANLFDKAFTLLMSCKSQSTEYDHGYQANIYLKNEGLFVMLAQQTKTGLVPVGSWNVVEIVRGSAKGFISRESEIPFSLQLPIITTTSPFRPGTLVFGHNQNRIKVLCKYTQ